MTIVEPYGQRSKWLRDGRVSQSEYDCFDANLYEEWKSRFELLQDETEDKNVKERKEVSVTSFIGIITFRRSIICLCLRIKPHCI